MNSINPQAKKQSGFLKKMGPVILILGILFLIVGLGSFFMSFGGGGRPRFFWCAFVGMPLILVGGVMTQMGFLKNILKYTAGEAAPVAKDTFNYTARGTKEGVKDIASSVAEGFREGSKPSGTVEERLAKLEALRSKGLIDDGDFEEQKDRILNDI